MLNSPRATRFFFERIGQPYRWLTDNPLWRESIHEMSRHLPPSGSELRLLDVGCGPGNSALQMLDFRADLRIVGVDFAANILKQASAASVAQHSQLSWAQADAAQLPLPDNSMDAVMAHSVLYMLSNEGAFLREVLRVLRPGGRLIMLNPMKRSYPLVLLSRAWRSREALSVLVWHSVSRMHRRYTLESMAALLQTAGYDRILAESAAGGFGVLSRGEKPYTYLSTLERTAQTAVRDESTALQVVEPAQLESASRGRFVFVLVKQSPDKPAWKLAPDEVLRWQAATVTDAQGRQHILAFTSLPKAVEFMQPAVKAGQFFGISKVAKYAKSAALEWGAPLVLNPSFDSLRLGDTFRLSDRLFEVNPQRAVTGEE